MGDPKMYTLKVEGGKIGDFTGIQIQFQEEGEENTELKDAITRLLTPPAQQTSTVQQLSGTDGGRRRKRRTKVKSKKRAHRRKRTRHQH